MIDFKKLFNRLMIFSLSFMLLGTLFQSNSHAGTKLDCATCHRTELKKKKQMTTMDCNILFDEDKSPEEVEKIAWEILYGVDDNTVNANRGIATAAFTIADIDADISAINTEKQMEIQDARDNARRDAEEKYRYYLPDPNVPDNREKLIRLEMDAAEKTVVAKWQTPINDVSKPKMDILMSHPLLLMKVWDKEPSLLESMLDNGKNFLYISIVNHLTRLGYDPDDPENDKSYDPSKNYDNPSRVTSEVKTPLDSRLSSLLNQAFLALQEQLPPKPEQYRTRSKGDEDHPLLK